MKFIDLFAGLGGFHVALDKFGCECVFASEIEKSLMELYERNHGIKCHGDILAIDPDDIPDHDILCGGFPCQAFSLAGRQEGFEDPRGQMIFRIADILKSKRPEFFILENVRMLVRHNKGQTFKTILELLNECGYYVKWKILSPHHFGVPQQRYRAIICGSLNPIWDFQFPKPTHEKEDNSVYDILEDNATGFDLSDEYIKKLTAWGNYVKQYDRVPRIIDGSDDPEIAKLPISKQKLEWQTDGNDIWDKVLIDRQSGFQVSGKNVFNTLTTVGQRNVIMWEKRYLTTLELARLQSLEGLKHFPEGNTAAVRAFGNAVNALVIEKVAERFLNHKSNNFWRMSK